MCCGRRPAGGNTPPALTFSISKSALQQPNKDASMVVVGAKEDLTVIDFDTTIRAGKLAVLPLFVVDDLISQGAPIWIF